MNQTSPTSDNLFLRSYATWRGQSTKLTGKLLLLALIPLAMIVLLLGVTRIQLHTEVASHADKVGEELARQIAASLADPLAAEDQLSLNIQLAQWDRNPLIRHIRLYTAENRLIAEAGSTPGRGHVAPGQGQFSAVVHFRDEIVGQIQLSLAAEPFVGPSSTLLWRLFWATLILALLAGLTAWRLGNSMRRTLGELGTWYGDSGQSTPGNARRDELGDLARQLEKRRIIDMPPEPEPIPEPEEEAPAIDADPLPPVAAVADERLDSSESAVEASQPTVGDDATGATNPPENAPNETSPEEQPALTTGQTLPTEPMPENAPDSPAAPAETAVLAVRLGNQEALRRLARPRLMAVLERYREQLLRATELYNGHLQTLQDGTGVVTFHSKECRQDELAHALCCGELLRVLGHELQVEIADTGITLHLQLAIGHCADLRPIPEEELPTRAECQSVLEIVQHSRNLLLLDAALAESVELRERGIVRRLASQPGIYCIERLHGSYQAMLEQQLMHFYHQRPD